MKDPAVELRSQINRAKLVEAKKNEIREWYFYASGANPNDPDASVDCDECDSYDALSGAKLWWLEPPIPNVDNPVLVETPVGNDGWQLDVKKMSPKIRSYGGL